MSYEEKNRIYQFEIMSFLFVTFVFAGYVVFIMRTAPLQNGWDYLIRLGVPYSIAEPIVCFSVYELFFPKRLRGSPSFHLKRFARRTTLALLVLLSFVVVIAVSDLVFSQTLGSEALFPGMVTWVSVFLAAIFLWFRKQLSKSTSLQPV